MRPVRSVPLLVVAVMLATLAPISPAHADTVEVTCEGGFHTVKWDPPLIGTEPQDTSFESNGGYGGDFTGICNFADSTAGSMTFHMAGEATASCVSGSGDGNMRITWDNDETSFISPLNVAFAPNPGGTGLAINATGTVKHGRFAGSSVDASFTQTADPTQCIEEGIAVASGPCPQLTFTNTNGPASQIRPGLAG